MTTFSGAQELSRCSSTFAALDVSVQLEPKSGHAIIVRMNFIPEATCPGSSLLVRSKRSITAYSPEELMAKTQKGRVGHRIKKR